MSRRERRARATHRDTARSTIVMHFLLRRRPVRAAGLHRRAAAASPQPDAREPSSPQPDLPHPQSPPHANPDLPPDLPLADVLAKVRTDAGLTQEQLATALDMTARTVARLETGQMRPSTLTLERIAEATGTILRIRFDPPATPS